MEPHPIRGSNFDLFRVYGPQTPNPMDVEESVPPSETGSTANDEESSLPDEFNSLSGTVTPSSGVATPYEHPSAHSTPPPPQEVAGAIDAIDFQRRAEPMDMPRADAPRSRRPGESHQEYETYLGNYIERQRTLCMGEGWFYT